MMFPKQRLMTWPPGAVAGVVILAVAGLVWVPQMVAVAVTAPERLQSGARLRLHELVGLWGQADPTVVTGSTWPGWVHWGLVTCLMVAVMVAVVIVLVVVQRRARDPERKPGLAPLALVVRELGAQQLVRVRGPKLRPLLPSGSIRPQDVGFRVGVFRGVEVWLRVEDPTILVGPSRAGKGFYLVLHWIISAPGAVVTTSSKLDNALITMRYRMRQGSKVWLFAPGVPGGEALGHVLRWDPVAGCVDEATLVCRIHALIPRDAFSGSTSNGGHWDTLGQQLAAALFHAAACMGADVDKIWEWVGSPQRALQAVAAIREHPDGLAEYATHLETVIRMPPEQRASQWGVLPTVLAFLGSRSARAWMKPKPGEEIDLVEFVLGKGTLYLVGDKQTTGGYVRIIDGLLAEIDYVTKGLADASPGARVDPPVSYILDEAGNFEYQGLYELITAGGGRGRVGLVVFQSKAQLEQWGRENAATLWDAAVAKIVLPGGADESELRALSDLIGQEWQQRESHSWSGGSVSVQVSEEKRAVIEASEIRELASGYALVFYRNLKPLVVKLRPFSENSVYAECERDAKELSEELRAASPFADRIAAAGRRDA